MHIVLYQITIIALQVKGFRTIKENPGVISCCCFAVISNPCRVNSFLYLLDSLHICGFKLPWDHLLYLCNFLLVSRIMGSVKYEKSGTTDQETGSRNLSRFLFPFLNFFFFFSLKPMGRSITECSWGQACTSIFCIDFFSTFSYKEK